LDGKKLQLLKNPVLVLRPFKTTFGVVDLGLSLGMSELGLGLGLEWWSCI